MDDRERGRMMGRAISAAAIPFVLAAQKGELDDVTMTEYSDMFSPWDALSKYGKGDIRRYEENGELYRCLMDHQGQADWSPDKAPSLWVKIGNPADEWPEWSAPIGAHDAYLAGDKVSHNGKHWTSDIDGNVWEPGVYGWTEVPV